VMYPQINAPRRKPTLSQDARAAASFDSTAAVGATRKFNKYDIRSYEKKAPAPASPEKRPGAKRDNMSRKQIKDRAMLVCQVSAFGWWGAVWRGVSVDGPNNGPFLTRTRVHAAVCPGVCMPPCRSWQDGGVVLLLHGRASRQPR